MRYTVRMTTSIALQTEYGQIVHADSLAYMRDSVADGSVDLVSSQYPVERPVRCAS